MSVDINWEAFTTGEDGERLALAIRDFIHEKFQQVPLPKFIQSVRVVSFEFGKIAPDIEIKTICDPYPEFYEDTYAGDADSDEEDELVCDEGSELRIERERRRRERRQMVELEGDENDHGFDSMSLNFSGSLLGGGVHHQRQNSQASQAGLTPFLDRVTPGFRSVFSPAADSFRTPGAVTTPLFPFSSPTGGASNLHYFHSALSSSFSNHGSPKSLPFQSVNTCNVATSPPNSYNHQGSPSSGSLSSPPSTGDSSHIHPDPPLIGLSSKPTLQHPRQNRDSPSPDGTREPPSTPSNSSPPNGSSLSHPHNLLQTPSARTDRTTVSTPPRPLLREPRDEDLQITARVRYAGDVRMELTTQLLFDYPARSFVSLPVRLVVTGLTFDGTAVLAYIGKRVHFCFLEDDGTTSEEFTNTSSENNMDGNADGGTGGRSFLARSGGGMLKEIKVESEIGEKGRGKQVLKNVGKVERFVLEQVRRIFEDEFVFPSSWTFLV